MKFYKEGEIPNVGNMYFVYGGKSTGKTYMATQFKGKKLMFNFDGSTNAVASTKDIRVIAFEHSDAPNIQRDLMYWLDNQLYQVNENGERVLTDEFSAIILDNVTAALMLDLRTDFSLPCKLIAEEHFLYDSIFTRI